MHLRLIIHIVERMHCLDLCVYTFVCHSYTWPQSALNIEKRPKSRGILLYCRDSFVFFSLSFLFRDIPRTYETERNNNISYLNRGTQLFFEVVLRALVQLSLRNEDIEKCASQAEYSFFVLS